MHLRFYGDAGRRLILLECGLTMMSSSWGWLGPELGKNFRVLAYDRSGLGWSEEREGLRSSEQVALELSSLLRVIGAKEPFIYLGHSLGAMHARAFHKIFPEALSGVVFLDGAHPEQMKRVKRIRLRMRNFFILLEAAELLARKGWAGVWSDFPITAQLKELPAQERQRALSFFRNARHLRTSLREARSWDNSAEFISGSTLGELPLLMISAQKNALPRWNELQTELATLSNRSKRVVLTEASHISLFSRQEQARKVAEAILGFNDLTLPG
jgi:pimeloyl-ACP methyl ester carboxylesterase